MDGAFEMVCKTARSNPEYIINKKRSIDLGRKIMELLGPDKALFLEYENTCSLAEGINIESAFLLGSREGNKAMN